MSIFNSKSVVIVLVNYKRPEDTLECVRSLLRLSYKNWSCVICENGSGDNSYEVIKVGLNSISGSNRHDVNLIEEGSVESFTIIDGDSRNNIFLVGSSENRGFAGGNNHAVRLISTANGFEADYYWFLNNDTVVDENSLTELVSFMASNKGHQVGICGSTILYYNGNNLIQCRGGAKYSPLFGTVKEIGNLEAFDPGYIDSSCVDRLDYVSGASMFTTKEFLAKVGLMSEEYFLYFEELDWACRAKENGFELGYVPRSLIWHKEGLVLGSGASEKRSELAEFYGLRSRLKFTINHYPLCLPVVWLVGVLQLIKRLLNFKFRNSRSLFRALSFKSEWR